MKPRLVLSGVNLVEAGPLSIFEDALQALARDFLDRYEIVALVHSRALFQTPGITYMEFPAIKSSWLRRLRFEYWDCRELSRELKPYLWLSMHDMTPNVEAAVRAVYCHNPAPFYRPGFRELAAEWKIALFSLLYRYLYSFNIAKNDFVVVQQQWMRDEFRRRYGAREIIVAHPSIPQVHAAHVSRRPAPQRTNLKATVFFFPAYPRTFKNVELLLSAAESLERRGRFDFEVWLTIKGTENPYAAALHRRFTALASVRWLGVQARSAVQQLYDRADCLVFPSRLETWGMPISEFKQTGKPMLVADLPYGHETVGDYANARFLSPVDAEALADAMQELIQATFIPQATVASNVEPPFAKDWHQLFDILLADRADMLVMGEDTQTEGA